MKYVSFTMRNSKVLHGIITRLEWLSTSTDESHYSIVLESRLDILTDSRRGTLYQNLTVSISAGQNGNILVNTPYLLTTPSGQTATGNSDNEGRSAPAYTLQQENGELHVLMKTPQPEE